MKVRSSHRRGFTLVELLVVMAIVSIILGLSIPGIARLGLVGGSEQELAGRELFTLLRAAKIYATTYNVETALAYSVHFAIDSESEGSSPLRTPFVDAMVIARQLKPNEKRARAPELFAAGFSDLDDPIFVPLRTREGRFKFFSKGTCVLNDLELLRRYERANPDSRHLEIRDIMGVIQTSFGDAMAMDFITLYDEDVYEVISLRGDTEFPAHVFGPSGAIVGDIGVQRIRLHVGLRPDASPDDRFFIDPETGQFEVDFSTGERKDNAVVVSLYTALGRVNMSS